MGFFDAFNSVVKPRPETKEELISMITTYMATGDSLNNIDVSAITDMSHLFEDSEWDGDISSWDVSHVTNMERMFRNSKFNGDISKWDVSNVENMEGLFSSSEFNGDISKWNVSKVTNMRSLFYGTKFTGDISGWDVSNVSNMRTVFYKSKFNGNISNWNVSKVQTMESMFMNSEFNGDISGWDVSNVENMKDIFKGSKFKGNIFNWHIDKVQDVSSLWEGGWSPEDSQMLKNHFCRETTEPNKSEKQTADQEMTQNSAKGETLNSELKDVLAQFGGVFGGGLGFGKKSASQPTETKKDASESNSKSAGNSSGISGNYFVDPRDGQKYRTVKIGDQIWMAENLRYKCKSGCYAYRDDESNVNVMGRLYEWDVAENACPPGWHLPDDNEWLEFKKNTGLYEAQQDEIDNSFRKIIVKPWAENLEILPHLDETLPPSRYRDLKEKEVNQQLKEIDSLKVSLVPSGRRDYDAYGKPYYSYYGINAYFWSATLCEGEISIGKYERIRQYLCFGEMSKWTDKRYDERNVPELDPYPSAFSIRCIKD